MTHFKQYKIFFLALLSIYCFCLIIFNTSIAQSQDSNEIKIEADQIKISNDGNRINASGNIKIETEELNSISNETAIKIPNNLTDIIIRHVDFTVSFEDSNLNKLEHILLEKTKIIIPKPELLSSVSQEKLEFLYLNINNQHKQPIPIELDLQLQKLDSDVYVRTPGLNDNEKFFS